MKEVHIKCERKSKSIQEYFSNSIGKLNELSEDTP